MCGRYTLIRLHDVLERFPWIEHAPPDLVPRYNIAPTQPLLVIANDNPGEYDYLTWGLVPSWAKDPTIGNRMINARVETLTEKPAFAKPLRRRRCLVIADGFYEWRKDGGDGRKSVKTPVRVRMRDLKPFAFAGLWEHWQSPNGSEVKSCAIITTPPNELMSGIHDRMPAIVPPELYLEWIDPAERDGAEMASILGPYPAEAMEAYPVSRTVNSPRNEVPACVEPVEKETLF
jgi:putative SOS response-associated peptidase YedK